MKGNGFTVLGFSINVKHTPSEVRIEALRSLTQETERAFTLVHEVLSLAWGGGDGVIRGASKQDLKVEDVPPHGKDYKMSTNLFVYPGKAFISHEIFSWGGGWLPDITPPTKQPRIDLVQACLHGWAVEVVKGEESDSPSIPDLGANCLPLAHLYMRPGMTCIKDEDDGTNGYIIDARQYV